MSSLTISTRQKGTPLDPEFEQLKPLMEELYMKQGMTLKEVSRIMEEQYSLKATKHRYEKAFRRWNWSKNITSCFWDSVCLGLFRLKDSTRRLEVFYNGDKIDDDRIQREMSRRSAAFFQIRQGPLVLPDGLVILARTDRSSTLFFRLPFHVFRDLSTITEQSGPHRWSLMDVPTGGLDGIAVSHAGSSFLTLTHHVVNPTVSPLSMWFSDPGCAKILESVTFPILSSITLPGTLTGGLGMQIKMTEYHWRLLLSIANNFAGLAGLDVERFLPFLRNEMSQTFHSMIQRTSFCHTTRSLVCNLMRLSIGTGDAETINFILRHGNSTINADTLICAFNGVKCTALEKASCLQHTDVVKVLLHHKANTWTTAFTRDTLKSRNALDFVIDHYANRDYATGRTMNPEIGFLLIEAGGKVTCSSLTHFIENGNWRGDLARSLLEATRIVDKENFVDKGVLHAALTHLDEACCLKLLSHWDNVISDINYPFQYAITGLGCGRPGSRLLDIAVGRGYFRVVEELFHRGATLSPLTLTIAINGNNEKLVVLLIKRGAKLGHKFRRLNQDLKSSAQTRLHGSVSNYSWQYKLPDAVKLSGYFKYASPHPTTTKEYEPGATRSGDESDHEMGLRLVMAIKSERDEEAEELITSGAELNTRIGECHGPPLHEALMRRNAALVGLLLDAGADPNFPGFETGCTMKMVPAIDIAVCWGDYAVIQKLVDAGAHVHNEGHSINETRALLIAVQNSDRALVSQLLRSSPHPSQYQWHMAIQAATDKDDVEMVRLLLESGACLGCVDYVAFRKSYMISRYDHGYQGLARPVDKYNLEEEEIVNAELFDHPKEYKPESFDQSYRLLDSGIYGTTDYHVNAKSPKEEANSSAMNDFRRQVEESQQERYYKPLGLHLVGYNSEIHDLLLDFYKRQCLSCYRQKIILTLVQLIWSADYQKYTNLVDKRFRCISNATDSRDFRFLYYDAIVRAKHGDVIFVKQLLEHSCSPQALICEAYSSESLHLTAFLGAITTGRTDVVKLFIQHKADINFPPQLQVKRTPLQQAASYGYLDIANLLITHGADVNAPAAKFGGATALQLAAIGGYNAVIDLLVTYGADVDAPAAKVNGRTALEGAAEHGRLDTVKVLLNAGAAHNGEDKAQIDRAISYADDSGHPYISDLLREHIVDDTIQSEVSHNVHNSPDFNDPHDIHDPFDEEFFDWNRWDENAISTE